MKITIPNKLARELDKEFVLARAQKRQREANRAVAKDPTNQELQARAETAYQACGRAHLAMEQR